MMREAPGAHTAFCMFVENQPKHQTNINFIYANAKHCCIHDTYESIYYKVLESDLNAKRLMHRSLIAIVNGRIKMSPY